MNSLKIFTIFVLFFVLFVEGFIVLSYELQALRLVMPYAGAGAETAAIVIAAVLFSLALGYQAGGSFRPIEHAPDLKIRRTIRSKILLNFLIAAPFMTLGSSYFFVDYFFTEMQRTGIESPLLKVSIYSLVLLAIPVFFLGQTVPLISNYFSHARISQATGFILLISTLGSLAGALVTTLVLMPQIGVHNAAIVMMAMLFSITYVLTPKRRLLRTSYVAIFFLITSVLNSGPLLESQGIVANNQYHTAIVQDTQRFGKVLYLNRAPQSAYKKTTGAKWPYIEFVEDNFIYPASERLDRKLDILVIGAGGFTLGAEDTKNRYVFVDIDSDLKDIAETHILERELRDNKEFVAQPARRFLKGHTDRYDLIVLDAYHGASIPDHLVTREFFLSLKNIMKPDSALVANFIMSPTFESTFSRNLYATFSSVFWPVSRQILGGFDGGVARQEGPEGFKDKYNVMHLYFDGPGPDEARIYTDLVNRAALEVEPAH